MYFIKNSKREWWELDRDKMTVFNFHGGSHTISKQILESSEILECADWHALYERTNFCPLEVGINYTNVWVSPAGMFYDGDAHDNRAEEILEIVYGETDCFWPGDRLEERGWVRATTSLMWEVRADSDYWDNKKLSPKQYTALQDWCQHHNKKFPQNVTI